MKEKKRRSPRRFDAQFKLGVLKEYYESGCSLVSISRKYSIGCTNIRMWERKFATQSLPLPPEISELEARVFMARAKKEQKNRERSSSPFMSEEERLRDENSRLRKALEYSELRNEALNEVLKIGREQYGIDLLKKAGAKQ